MEAVEKDMVDAPGVQDEEAEQNVDVDGDGTNEQSPIETVDENPVSPHVGIDIDGDMLNKGEAVPSVGEGDGIKVESSSVISTTYALGNMNGVNDIEIPEADESATEDEYSVFMRELDTFYRDMGMEFKHPKFYGEPLDCLKLWKSVIQLGGYERVTGAKLWRQVGEAFNPPKTCTTVSWTFRIFYEKALWTLKSINGQLVNWNLLKLIFPNPPWVIVSQPAIKLQDQVGVGEILQLVLCKDGIANMMVLLTLKSQLSRRRAPLMQ